MITTTEYRQLAVPVRERLHQVFDSLPPLSEICWFLVALVLFMVLGPFAAPIALLAIFRLDPEHRGWREPDAVE